MTGILGKVPGQLARKFSLNNVNGADSIMSLPLLGSSGYTTARNLQSRHERSNNTGSFLHKLDLNQRSFFWGHRSGTKYTVMVFTLNSKKPLSPDLIHQAMIHWQRKSPCFQIVIKERERDLWFYGPKYCDVDFKVVKQGTPFEEVLDECSGRFDEANGPLWRSRLLLEKVNDLRCRDLEVEKQYPHQCHLVLCTHHSVVDGATIFPMVQPALDIIDNLIEGKKIDESLAGVFISNEESTKLYAKAKERLISNPERLETLRDLTLRCHKPPILLKRFPRPEVANPSTKHLFMEMDQPTIEKFIEKCRLAGVTLGSGLQMVVNTALVELVQEVGVSEESYEMSTHMVVDMRRYFRTRELPIHGCFVKAPVSFITLDKRVRRNFWNNCQALHEINLDILRNKQVFEQEVAREMFLETLPPEKFFENPPVATRDYGFNNVSQMHKLMPGRGKHIQVTNFAGLNGLHRCPLPFMFVFHKYRGFHNAEISYASDWLTEENAMTISEKVKSLLENFSR
ncbi:uncharacterized protein [Palaemon carinicauda]|uniref:uncharacterized protein n=1 Tax=Palaemon carinicauda TaxID=392227 RepID=UPI0035B60D5A